MPPASAVRAASFDRRVGSLSGPASHGCRSQALRLLRRPPRRWRWGFCSIRGWLSACRRRVESLMTPFPRLVAVRSRFEVVRCPKCRPPRRKTLKTGCYGRSGLRFGHNGVYRGVLLAREPLNMRVNDLMCSLTLLVAWWAGSPTRISSGPRADHRAQVQVIGPRAHQRAQAQDTFTEKKWGLTARRPPDALNMPRETTEAGSRRVTPLVAYGRGAVGTEKSRYQQHVESYNPPITPNTGQLPRQGSRRIRKPPRFEGSAGVMRGDGGI